MLNSLNAGISGMQQFQTSLDVIGNDIANSNTLGFKSARVDFADAFSQTLQHSDSNGALGMQIGSGVSTAAIKNNYTQGSINTTGVGTDMAISGEGFFVVHDLTKNLDLVTRAGDFHVDTNGYLVTNQGMRVQGFTDATLTTRGDIKIDTTGAADPSLPIASYVIGSDGKVTVTQEGGTSFVRGQVLLQSFLNPQALMKQGNNLYSGIANAGPLGGSAAPQAEAVGTNGLGTMQVGALELSNVDLAAEFASMITAQRGFQASARIITTSDEMLQELVNLKH